MGISILGRSSDNQAQTYDRSPDTSTAPNPDPRNYRIVRSQVIGQFTILMVNYPDCTTYNGNKVLVYFTENYRRNSKSLDPHFLKNSRSPIARFIGDDLGFSFGVRFAKLLEKEARESRLPF